MTKKEKTTFRTNCISYGRSRQTSRIVHIKNSKQIYKSYQQILNSSKKIYSIPKQVYGQKPNKIPHLERILQCGGIIGGGVIFPLVESFWGMFTN